jgi:hypothetical protein
MTVSETREPEWDPNDSDDEFRVPDAISPITGYRVWEVLGDGFFKSPNEVSAWEEGRWMRATCARFLRRAGVDPEAAHRAPAEYCRCGFYAFKSADRVIEQLERYRRLPSRRHIPYVSGVVELAGKVIEHEHGYRAELARISTRSPLG